MELTVTNQLATSLEIGFPINRTLGPNGGGSDAVTLGVSERDLLHGEDKGDPAYKRLNYLSQIGSIVMSIAADADTTDLLDLGNEV